MDPEEEKKANNRILRELRILRLCNSPNVVSFYGAFLHEQDIFIMMEFMDLGSLESIYKKYGPIPEAVVGKISLRILQGLIYLYQNHKIVHRDMKPSNILMSSLGEVKIADFGVSKQLTNGTMAMTFTGTQAYLAPERVREGSNCSPVADVWGVGLTIVEVATGVFPFPPEAMNSVMDLLEFINEEPSPTLTPGTFTDPFHSFIAHCLQKNPNERATPEQLLQSSFIVNTINGPDVIQAWAGNLFKK